MLQINNIIITYIYIVARTEKTRQQRPMIDVKYSFKC